MIRAEFRLRLPDDIWVTAVSTECPEATFRLLTGVPVGERTLELGEVFSVDPGRAVDTLLDHPDVVAADVLFVGDDRALVKYETGEQGLFRFLGDTSLPPEFPIGVEDGVMEFTVTATRAQFEAFAETLDGSGHGYELLSVVHAESRSDVLTARQRECLNVARRNGYFEVPRDCSLEDVATKLEVDTSTASETLRRGSARILDWFFLEEA